MNAQFELEDVDSFMSDESHLVTPWTSTDTLPDEAYKIDYSKPYGPLEDFDSPMTSAEWEQDTSDGLFTPEITFSSYSESCASPILFDEDLDGVATPIFDLPAIWQDSMMTDAGIEDFSMFSPLCAPVSGGDFNHLGDLVMDSPELSTNTWLDFAPIDEELDASGTFTALPPPILVSYFSTLVTSALLT